MPQHLWRRFSTVRACEGRVALASYPPNRFSTVRACEVCLACQTEGAGEWIPPVGPICPGDRDDDAGGRRGRGRKPMPPTSKGPLLHGGGPFCVGGGGCGAARPRPRLPADGNRTWRRPAGTRLARLPLGAARGGGAGGRKAWPATWRDMDTPTSRNPAAEAPTRPRLVASLSHGPAGAVRAPLPEGSGAGGRTLAYPLCAVRIRSPISGR